MTATAGAVGLEEDEKVDAIESRRVREAAMGFSPASSFAKRENWKFAEKWKISTELFELASGKFWSFCWPKIWFA